MTEEDSKLLSTFEARFRQLLYLYEQLGRENEALKTTLSQRDEHIRALQEAQELLESKYARLKLAKIISINESEAKESKQRISKLVREVEKCIALLNS